MVLVPLLGVGVSGVERSEVESTKSTASELSPPVLSTTVEEDDTDDPGSVGFPTVSYLG